MQGKAIQAASLIIGTAHSSQNSQLAERGIYLDFAAASDRGSNILVKTNKHGQIGECGTLYEDGIYGVEHECKGYHPSRSHFVEHPSGCDTTLCRVQNQ